MRISLNLKFVFAATVLFIAGGILASWLSSRDIENDLSKHIEEEQINLTDHIVDLLDHDLAQHLQALVRKASLITSDTIADRQKAQRFLDESAWLQTVFDNGLFLFLTNGTLYVESPKQPSRTVWNLTFRDYLKDTLRLKTAIISSPYISSKEHHHPAIMLTAPVFDTRGHLIAVLAGSIDLTTNTFFAKFRDLKFLNHGYFSIITGNGICILHPDTSRIMTKMDSTTFDLISSNASLKGPATVQRTNYQGVNLISTVKRLRVTDWIVSVNAVKDEVYASVRQTRQTFARVLIFGIPLMIISIFLISRIMTKPLRSMTRQIRNIQDFSDLDNRVSVQSHDEIMDLAGAVNNMLDTIVASQQLIQDKDRIYQAWFDKSKDGILFLDEEWNITDINETGRAMFDVPTARLTNLADLLGSDDIGMLRVTMATQGYLKDVEIIVHRNTGLDAALLFTCVAVKELNGVPTVYLCMLRDITEHKRAEEALGQSEEKYRTLFQESKDAIFVSAPEGRFLDINPAGVELLGYSSKEELLGIDINRDIYINPEDRKIFQKMLNENGFVKDHEIEMKRKDEKKLTVLSTATAVKDEKGCIASYRGIMRDITEHKILEHQLLQSQKMEAVGQLAGGIAHDFNNILSVIMGYGFFLQTKMRTDDPLLSHVDQILDSAKRAAQVTRSLLAFSRKQMMNPAPVNINDLVVRFEKLLSRLIGEDIEVIIVLDGGSLICMADTGQLEQVLMNLATNARDVMPRGGKLTISTSLVEIDDAFIRTHGYGEPGTFALVSVSDTGIGMNQMTAEKIFEPFFTTKETGKGTGLGLAMVYGIVKQHDGFINVQSEPGKGTTFNIYLPVIKLQIVPVNSPSEQFPESGTEVILVAEDDEKLRKLYDVVLTQHGYKVILVENGEDAVDSFVKNKDSVQMVILDMVMPKKNGKEAAYEITHLRPDTKILFLSGYTADRIDVLELQENNLNFLFKPVSPRDLLTKVRAILDI